MDITNLPVIDIRCLKYGQGGHVANCKCWKQLDAETFKAANDGTSKPPNGETSKG